MIDYAKEAASKAAHAWCEKIAGSLKFVERIKLKVKPKVTLENVEEQPVPGDLVRAFAQRNQYLAPVVETKHKEFWDKMRQSIRRK